LNPAILVFPIPLFVIEVVTPDTVVLDCNEPPDAVIVAIPALNVTSSPVPKSIVVAEPTFTALSLTATPVPDAVTFSRAEPSIAGSAPVSCPEGRFVSPEPDPENDDAVMIPLVLIFTVEINEDEIPLEFEYVDTPDIVEYVDIPLEFA
jgi:hypothetical protein